MGGGKPKEGKMVLKSPAFSEGEPIPKVYTGEGKDISPALEMSGVPPQAKQFALICDDPDAPTPEPWVHWILYKIPPTLTRLPEAIPPKERLETPSVFQGKTSWPDRIGYGGPMPPPGHGWHRYFFKLYALDSELGLGPGATKAEILQAMKGHILSETALMGKYKR